MSQFYCRENELYGKSGAWERKPVVWEKNSSI